jgi:ribosomal protein S18 acetylase RimI-like enzyme
LQLSSGWGKALARPWNEDFVAAALRVERGSARFLRSCTEFMRNLVTPVLSPALLPFRARMWTEAGYAVADQLALLEHDLRRLPPVNGTTAEISLGHLEPSNELYEIDQAAFPVRWRIGRRGLAESVEATNRAAVHRLADDVGVVGFSVTGLSLGQGYLQRLAVHPRARARGYGAALVGASLRWARSHGARAILVNTQNDNEAALRLYKRIGFEPVAGGLVVMTSDPD